MLGRCQQAGCWWHRALPPQDCSLQYLCKNMGAATPRFQKCPMEGKTPLSLQESCRIWLGFHDDSSNNNKISSVVQKQGERQNSSWLHANFLPLPRPAPAFPPGLLLLPQPLSCSSAQPTNLLQEYAKNPSVWRSWDWLPHPQKSRQCSEQTPGAMGQRTGLEWQTPGGEGTRRRL